MDGVERVKKLGDLYLRFMETNPVWDSRVCTTKSQREGSRYCLGAPTVYSFSAGCFVVSVATTEDLGEIYTYAVLIPRRDC